MLCTRTAVLATAFAFFLSVAVAVSMPTLLGGHSEASTDSQEVQQAAKFAVAQLSGKNDFSGDGKLSLKRVVSAKHQVVAGVNYHLTIETEDGSGKVQLVDVTVWQKPVQSGSNELPMELTHFKVASGPVAEVDPLDKWTKAAQHATDAINARCNHLFRYTLGGHTLVLLPGDDTVVLELKLHRQHTPLPDTFIARVKQERERFSVLHFEQRQEGQQEQEGEQHGMQPEGA